MPCQVEPQGLSRNDGKRPDGVTLLLWRNGRPLIWDATCSDTFAPTYSSMASIRAGAVADAAETRKAAQYRHLLATHIFAPVAIETSGNFGSDTHLFLKEISERLKSSLGEALSHAPIPTSAAFCSSAEGQYPEYRGDYVAIFCN